MLARPARVRQKARGELIRHRLIFSLANTLAPSFIRSLMSGPKSRSKRSENERITKIALSLFHSFLLMINHNYERKAVLVVVVVAVVIYSQSPPPLPQICLLMCEK